MMRNILILAFGLLAFHAAAVDRITASLSLTNTLWGTSNYMTLTVNGSTRTWTNNVVVSSQQIATNSTPTGSKTNLYNQIALNPFSQVIEIDRGATNIDLVGASGVALTVTAAGTPAGWATVTYSTQTVTSLIGVRVPISGEASGGQATNIASLVVKGANDLSTNSFYENAIAVVNLLGKTNAQTIAGVKGFTNAAGLWQGIVSNSAAIGGNVESLTNGSIRGSAIYSAAITNAAAIIGNAVNLTNGIYYSPILVNPTFTNGANYGDAFRSPGSATGSEQFGSGAAASGNGAVAVGFGSTASASGALALGSSAEASGVESIAVGSAGGTVSSGDYSLSVGDVTAVTGDYSTALGYGAGSIHTHSTAIGAEAQTGADNQIKIGTSSDYSHFPGNVRIDGNTELTWKRFANSSLANGNNAAVAVGTNTFMEVSGPSGAFTINGIAGGRDGKFLIILNQTGQNMTIAHDSGVDPTAANRIYTMTAGDRATTGNGAAMLIYSGTASRWMLISFDP